MNNKGTVSKAFNKGFFDFLEDIKEVFPENKDIDYAIREQLNRGISFSLATSLEKKLALKLKQHIPSAEQVRFSKNGSDVTTAAIRLARFLTKRERIVVCGYHGWHDWFISSTSMNRGIPNQVQRLTHTIKYNSTKDLEKIFSRYLTDASSIIDFYIQILILET